LNSKFRIFNFRLFFFTAVFVIAGVIIVSGAIARDYITVAIASAVAVIFGIFCFEAIRGTVKYKIKIMSAMLVLAGIAAFMTGHQISGWERQSFEESQSISGVVGEYIRVRETFVTAELIFVTINGEELDGGLLLTIWTSRNPDFVSYIESGRVLSMENLTINNTSLMRDGEWNAFNYKNDFRYRASVNASNVTVGGFERLPFWTRVRFRIKDALFDNLDEDSASLSYALITGDRSFIDEDLSGNFSASGLGHVLAVSGLHVSFVLLIINFVLKKLRCGKAVQLTVIILSLILFCLLSGMTASVVRAAIMGLIVTIAGLTGKRNDALNNLGLAAVIILLIRPMLLFDISFQMSFSATFGLILFSGRFNKLFRKIKIPSPASSTLSATLAATMGVFPITARVFGIIPVFTLLTHVLAMPFITLLFMMVFAGAIITVIFPFVGFTLQAVRPITWLIGGISELFASLPFSTVAIAGIGGLAVLYFLGLLFSSKFSFLGKRVKITIGVIIITFVICFNIIAGTLFF